MAEHREQLPHTGEELAEVIGIESRIGRFDLMEVAPAHFKRNLAVLARNTDPLTTETAMFVNSLVDEGADMVNYVANHPDFNMPSEEEDNDTFHSLTNLYDDIVRVVSSRNYEDKDRPPLGDFLQNPKSISKGLKILERHRSHLYTGGTTDTDNAINTISVGINLMDVLSKFLTLSPKIKSNRYLTLTTQELVLKDEAAAESMARRKSWQF